jgi:hypothetical protein
VLLSWRCIGALAAWFRLKYPHVTYASVASSAPVEATLDFFEYLDVVDQSLGESPPRLLFAAAAAWANVVS